MTSGNDKHRRAQPRRQGGASAAGRPFVRAIATAAFALVLGGCERGCLSTWLAELGVGRPSATPPKGALPLSGVDCPDGLARCVGGVVEVSRASHYTLPCADPQAGCMCPWDSLGPCPLGCAADGVEVVVPPERALAQLCATDPASPVARPIAPTAMPPGACDDVRESTEPPTTPAGPSTPDENVYRCLASIVVACSSSGGRKAVAACVRGCFHDGDTVDEEEADPDEAARILCAH